MNAPTQIDWLADASFSRVVTHPPTRYDTPPAKERPLDWLAQDGERMAPQFTRYDAPRARATDPETSHQAADKAETFIASHESRIFGALHDAGAHGGTYKELARRTGLEPVAVARRLSKMEERKLITRRIKDGSTADDDYQERGGMAIWWRA